MPAPASMPRLAHGSKDGSDVPAAVSIGVRPTFEQDGDLRVEAHLIGFEGDLYGRAVRLDFLERLRDELRFESAEELVEQMREDVEQAREADGGLGSREVLPSPAVTLTKEAKGELIPSTPPTRVTPGLPKSRSRCLQPASTSSPSTCASTARTMPRDAAC